MTRLAASRLIAADSVLRVRDFRRLWHVGVLLYAVRWLEILAMGVYAYQASGSAFLVASLTMVRLLPMAVFGVLLGAVADRVERPRALVAVVGLSLVMSVALALVAALGHLAVWHLVVASFVGGVAWAADNPVRRVMLGQAVGPERMAKAMSLDAGSNHASRVVGPVIGGAVLAAVGIAGTFAACAALYLLAFVAAARVRRGEPPPRGEPFALVAGFLESVAVARRDTRLAGALMVTVIFNLWGWPLFTMIPVIGKDRLGLGPEGVGVLAGLDGLGALVGAIVVAAIARPSNHRTTFVGGVALYLALTPVLVLSTVPALTGVALLLMGVGQAAFGITQATIVFAASPPHLRGRMLGLLTMCIGTSPLGVAHLGVLVEWMGVHLAGTLVAVEGAIAMALTRRWWRTI